MKFCFDAEKMENSPLRQQVKSKTKNSKLSSCDKKDFNYTDLEPASKACTSLYSDGFKEIDRAKYRHIANKLTSWGVSNSGAVIKREGPTFVLMAVNITMQNMSKVKSPKGYFRGILRKLQEEL